MEQTEHTSIFKSLSGFEIASLYSIIIDSTHPTQKFSECECQLNVIDESINKTKTQQIYFKSQETFTSFPFKHSIGDVLIIQNATVKVFL